jgi:hypothetical protein
MPLFLYGDSSIQLTVAVESSTSDKYTQQYWVLLNNLLATFLNNTITCVIAH